MAQHLSPVSLGLLTHSLIRGPSQSRKSVACTMTFRRTWSNPFVFFIVTLLTCQALPAPRSNVTTANRNVKQVTPEKKTVLQTSQGVKITVPPDKTATYYEAQPCDRKACKLPNCFCGGRNIPGDLPADQVPQMILLTFDDSVNDINWSLYTSLFTKKKTNPNGCPIRGTFYVSHDWTDYGQVQTLHARGHEIASHSISHSSGANFTTGRWFREIDGQRRILSELGQIPIEEIRGMRAPFLQPGGENQFAMLHTTNFSYDATLTTGDPSLWPYTLDYSLRHRCKLEPCPTLSFPGLWEVPLAMITGSNGRGCSMADSCAYPITAEGVKLTFLKNFNQHYNGNRAPLGLYFHFAWFATPHYRQGFFDFVDAVLQLPDVYFVTTWQMIEWMKEPTPLPQISSLKSWNCRQSRAHVDNECPKSSVCSLKFRRQDRYLYTCAKCPKNYPWFDNINGD